MNARSVKLLMAQSDAGKVFPILDALKAKGITVSEAAPGKGGTILAVLSENFYADPGLKKALLGAVSAGGVNVLPLRLDSAAIPEDLKNALYARNIISTDERDSGLIADRIIDALPAKKNRLPLLLLAGGAVLLVAAGLIFSKGMKGSQEGAPEVAEVLQEEEIPYPLPAGLTKEDLEKVHCVAILGSHFKYFTEAEREVPIGDSGWGDILHSLASESDENSPEGRRWFWNGDGSEITTAPYDLRFLSLLPNLEELHIAQASVTNAPDLTSLTRMNRICAVDSDLGDLSWITDSGIKRIQLRCNTDYTQLGKCAGLEEAVLYVSDPQNLDLSTFSPPALKQFELNAEGGPGGTADLSGLAGCARLKRVSLDSVPVRDLSFLEGKKELEVLLLSDMNQLEDISAVRSLTGLKQLRMGGVPSLQDFSPVAGCSVLERISIIPGNPRGLQDASFLGGLKKLIDIDLIGANLPSLDFLNQLAEGRSLLPRFHLSGSAGDYSGLDAFQTYETLELENDGGLSVEQVAPYLEGKTISKLSLSRFDNPDLSLLPAPQLNLTLERCNIPDLSILPEDWDMQDLSLRNCMVLSSLEGLGGQSGFGMKGGTLEIYNCPRLYDWNALEGKNLSRLEITGGFTLPPMGIFRTSQLCLDSVADVADLQFLDDMDSSASCSFKLVGLEGLNNLKPLERFNGTYITVSPELREQAQDLVSKGKFREFHIEYPRGGWELDHSGFSLMSLEELDTLPDAMLRRVTGFCMAGNTLADPNTSDIREEWHDGSEVPSLLIHEFDTDRLTPVEDGEGPVSNVDFLNTLTGLRTLKLYRQPLDSLDGIQNFGDLEFLSLCFCRNLTDLSPAFTLQNLRSLSVKECPVESIQGIQNLTGLWELDLSGSEVSDLSPLAECDFSTGINETGGFNLCLNGAPVEDYSPLSSIPVYDNLEINDVDPVRYLSYLEGIPIHRYFAANAFTERSSAEDADALFAQFVQGHPELTEVGVPWNNKITDLTPLLELEHLQKVRVSSIMEEAISSLEGEDVRFELEIEGE